MKNIDNITSILKDDLVEKIKSGSKMAVAAGCFSIYAFQELKEQLTQIDSCCFLFTSPTFIKDKIKKEKREFFIPRLSRERSIYGTEFEVRLRNQLNQKAIAKECAEWIKNKVQFLSNTTSSVMQNYMIVDDSVYYPMYEFTTVDLGTEQGDVAMSMKMRFDAPESSALIDQFNHVWNNHEQLQDVTEEVLDMISSVYQENSPELIYFMTLYQIFNEFLEDLDEDNLPNERTGFKDSLIWNKLYNFQKDAVLGIINKLEQYNGCILADSVGLGKTFTALAVIKYYESRNKTVLVLCPKKLSDNWNTYRDNYVNNPIAGDRLNYKVLFHTDLSREKGESNGTDLARLNWGNYDLVVIDESHNFRNGQGTNANKENRYVKLMKKIIKAGVKTKVLMLSATPVNNKFLDLRNQLALAYEGDAANLDDKLNTTSSVDNIFRQAQTAFNSWSKLPSEERTTMELQKRLDFDFFELLDSVTIARSRKHVQQYYDMSDIGAFPKRLDPISVIPKLTTLPNAVNYSEIFEKLMELNLHIYTPTVYILPSKVYKYLDEEEDANMQKGREIGIRRLMGISLLKRMESSVHSFRLSVGRIHDYISATVDHIEALKNGELISSIQEIRQVDINEFDEDDQNIDDFAIGKKFKIDLRDMDYLSWERKLKEDIEVLRILIHMVEPITPEVDYKLMELKRVIKEKIINNPINTGNKKVLVFTAFADTAEYLFENISGYIKRVFDLESALITGNISGKSTIKTLPSDMNMVLSCFSPVSKERDAVYQNIKENIDVLVATDCISEGQNLQDCDFCINYDIHWNPVRIIQRFGRIDRIGSINEKIQLVNFWPDIELDEYINLKNRVETRMKITVMTSTGDDDYINAEEKGDLEYRKQQLHRLMKEVVDIEEMSGGINIMDLGLNDFRMDLLSYIKDHPDIDHVPFGIHAVVAGEKTGVIFVLKNINPSINIENKNRLHPFYMVYISDDGEVIWDHLQAKELLDTIRFMARGKDLPDKKLCKIFNRETKDGRNMKHVSELLQDAISSIIHVKEESDIDSFFSGEQTTFLDNDVKGLEDFELICFMVVRND